MSPCFRMPFHWSGIHLQNFHLRSVMMHVMTRASLRHQAFVNITITNIIMFHHCTTKSNRECTYHLISVLTTALSVTAPWWSASEAVLVEGGPSITHLSGCFSPSLSLHLRSRYRYSCHPIRGPRYLQLRVLEPSHPRAKQGSETCVGPGDSRGFLS